MVKAPTVEEITAEGFAPSVAREYVEAFIRTNGAAAVKATDILMSDMPWREAVEALKTL